MKTITYDETKFQLLPISLDGNMITAAANTELLANRNHGEPASISDIWDALRAAAPQPEPSRMLAGWEMSPADMKSVGQELIDAAEAMSGGEVDCDLVLSVVPEGGFVDDDGVSNTHPILLVLCVDAEQEGGYPIDPWNVEESQSGCADVKTLVAYAEGRIQHTNNGICPDIIEGHDRRDPECPVCQAMQSAAQEPSHDDQ